MSTHRHKHPRKRESAVAAAEQLTKLVAVVQRQFVRPPLPQASAATPRPDDAAARALGDQVGEALVTFVRLCLDETVLKSVRDDQVLEGLLCQANLHPSVGAALFGHLVQAYQEDTEDLLDLHWLASWILRLEEAAVATAAPSGLQTTTLPAALLAYRSTLLKHHEVAAGPFGSWYQRLQHIDTRLQVIQMTTAAALQGNKPCLDVLAPLWATASLARSADDATAWAVVSHTSKNVRRLLYRRRPVTTVVILLDVLNLMAEALEWSLLGATRSTPAQGPLWSAWLEEILQLAALCWRDCVAGNPLTTQLFGGWWKRLWKQGLPRFLETAGATGGGDDLWEILTEADPAEEKEDSLTQQPLDWEATSALSWASWFLRSSTVPAKAFPFWVSSTTSSKLPTVQALSRLVTLCRAADSTHQLDMHPPAFLDLSTAVPLVLVISLLSIPPAHAQMLWTELLAKPDFAHSHFSAAQQTTALLCGMLLLQDEGSRSDSFAYLQALLTRYPHLGLTLLPVVVSLVNEAAAGGQGEDLMELLDFGSKVLVLDPHSATEFWNLLLQLLQPDQPVSLRSTVLRFFPVLCRANRRLYRRIMETMGGVIGENSVELRLAVAVTLAELAKHDLIRDVSDVIGWIQGWLSIQVHQPLDELLIYYALECLHHLVVAEELDFDVVVKVLNKRLCPVTDVSQIRQLHPVAQEALVRLLGDGECGSDDSEDEDGGEEGGGAPAPTVSPQVQRAVATLLELGVHLLEVVDMEHSTGADLLPEYRVLSSTIVSLHKYSNKALGLDEHDLKAALFGESSASSSLHNYRLLQRLVLDAMENPPDMEATSESTKALIVMAHRLAKFEEESLGASLWQRKGKASTSTSQSQASTKAFQAILPSLSTVEELAHRSPSMASAVSRLFCMDGADLIVLRDNADASIETDNPILLTTAIQAYLTATARICASHAQSLAKLLQEIESWFEEYVTADSFYLTMAAISVYIPHDARESGSSSNTFVEDIREAVLDAFRGYRFENTEVGKICLGIVGASSLREGQLSIASDIAEILLDSVQGYGGEQSFGAFYGLSLIAQMLPLFRQQNSGDEPRAARLYCIISGHIVEALLRCYNSDDFAITTILACLKSGTIQSDLITRLKVISPGSVPLHTSMKATSRYLSLCCAMALPSLARINGEILVALLHLFDALEWGGGKGIALPPLLNACRTVGSFQTEDLDQKYEQYSKTLEGIVNGEEGPEDALDDLLFAISGASSHSISHVLRRIVVGNSDLLDDESRAFSLLAALTKVMGLPCFGAAPFPQAVFAVPGASKLDTRDVVETLEEAAAEEDVSPGGKYSDMATISLAMLASISLPQPPSVENAFPSTTAFSTPSLIEPVLGASEFARLPTAHIETVVYGLMGSLERVLVENSAEGSRSALIVRLMGSLESLALPKQFSAHLLKSLSESSNDEVMTEAWVSLLISQCHGRRPATMDGSDFIQLYHRLAAADEAEWRRVLGSGPAVAKLVRGMEFFLPKCSQNHFSAVVVNVWRYCWKVGSSLQLQFLDMCKSLLASNKMPRKSTDLLVETLLKQVLVDLQSVPLSQVLQHSSQGQSIFKAYMECIQLASVELLDRHNLFRYGRAPGVLDGDVLRILFAAEVSSSESFESQRRQQERSKILAFLAQGLKVMRDDLSMNDLRYVCCALVETADPSRSKAEQLAEILEVLLQLPPQSSQFGLEWLALFVRKTDLTHHSSPSDISLAYLWSNDWRSSKSLPILAPMLMTDLPIFLGHVARQKQISPTVYHLLHRLLEHWSKPNVSPLALQTLRRSMATCRPSDEDVLVGIVADSLLASVSNEAESSTAMD